VKILRCFISDFEGTTLAFDRKVPGCQQSNARHIPLAFSFIDLVCIESNLLHNLIRKNPGRLPVRVSALKKPDKKQRVKDRGCKRGEKSERERGIWKLHSCEEARRRKNWALARSVASLLNSSHTVCLCYVHSYTTSRNLVS